METNENENKEGASTFFSFFGHRVRLDTMESQISTDSNTTSEYFTGESSIEDIHSSDDETSSEEEDENFEEAVDHDTNRSGDLIGRFRGKNQESYKDYSATYVNKDTTHFIGAKNSFKQRSSDSESSNYEGDPIIEEIRRLVRKSDDSIHSDSENEISECNSDSHIYRKSSSFERVVSDAIVYHAPIEELKVILEAGSRIIDPYSTKPNPIHYTVWQNYPEATQLLIEKGYDVNALDNFGQSALHLAARLGHSDIVEILISNGSRVNFNPVFEEKFPVNAADEPLRLALKYGHYECAQLLLQNGSDPNTQNFFGSEINLISPIRPDLLALLLMYGARIDDQDRNGLTALMKCSMLRQGMEGVLLLLSYGANVNIKTDTRHDNRTALHYGVLSDSIEIVKTLILNGADVRFSQDYQKPSALHLAIRKGNMDIINLLLDAGADINCSTPIIGSPLHMACSEKNSKTIEIVQLLLSRGADPNLVVLGLDGTPMLPALGDYVLGMEDLDTDVVKLLLRYGAKVVLKSPNSDPLGLLNCISNLNTQLEVLEELLEGAQKFDLEKIRKTCLIGEPERKICLQVAKDPLALRNLCRFILRQTTWMKCPQSVMKLDVPTIMKKYLLFEIS